MVFTVNLSSLNDVVEEVQAVESRAKLEKFESLFEYLKSFMKKRKIVIYGGTAMNMHLPKDNKIYTDDDFPDFDCFCLNPSKDIEDLANQCNKLNYKYIEIKHAMHDGTYKLYVDFEPIVDFTKVSKKVHDMVFHNAKLIDDYYVTNVKHLKSAAYLELAIPKSSIFRWTKVIQRVKLLEEEFKNNKSAYSTKSIQFISFNKKVESSVEKMKDFVIQNDLVLAGNHAIEYYLGDMKLEKGIMTKFMITNSSGIFQCLSADMKKTADNMKKILEKSFKKVTVVENSDGLITPYTSLFIEYFDDKYTFEKIKLNVCTVYSAEGHCYSYVKDKANDVKIASIFFILHIMYYSLFANDDRIDRVNVKNILNALTKKINIDHFNTECYGTEMTMNEIRRQRWDDRKKVVMLRMA